MKEKREIHHVTISKTQNQVFLWHELRKWQSKHCCYSVEIAMWSSTYANHKQAAAACQVLLSSDIGNTVADRIQTDCTILFPFLSSLTLCPCSPSLFPSPHPHLQPARCLHRPCRERQWLLCSGAVVFVCALLTTAACSPPGSPVCQRWLQQNRLWEQPVSLPWSPAPQPEGQPSIQRSPCPCTHKCPTKHTLTHKKSLQRSHPLPIILGSNFISTRVAAHCRQPLQSFLINSRFVPHPSFWTHLSYIPIGAAPSTPRQPPFANPTASPRPAAPPQGTLTAFFLSNLPITYLQSKVGALTQWVFWRQSVKAGWVKEEAATKWLQPRQLEQWAGPVGG